MDSGMMIEKLGMLSMGSPWGSQGQAGAPGTDKARSRETGPCGGTDLEALDVYGH